MMLKVYLSSGNLGRCFKHLGFSLVKFYFAAISWGSIICSYGLTVYLSRSLSGLEFGLYTVAMAIITLCVSLFLGGLGVKQLEVSSGEFGLRVLPGVFVVLSLFSLIAGGVYYAVYSDFCFSFLISALIFFLSSIRVLSSSLRGAGMRIKAVLYDSLDKILLAAFLLLISSLTVYDSDATNVLTLWFFCLLSVLIFLIRSTIKEGLALSELLKGFSSMSGGFKLWLETSPKAMILAFYVICGQADILIVNFLEGPEASGVYRISVAISMLFMIPVSTMSSYLVTDVAKALHSDSFRHDMSRKIQKGAALIFVLMLPVTAGIFIFGDVIVVKIFGNNFDESVLPSLVLIFFNQVSLFFGFVGVVASVFNRGNESVVPVFIFFVLNIILDFVLIGYYGILGAAISTGGVLLIYKAWLAYSLYRNHSILSLVKLWGCR